MSLIRKAVPYAVYRYVSIIHVHLPAPGTTVHLLGDVSSIMHELHTKWTDTPVGVASSCDEPSWARECILKFPVGGPQSGIYLKVITSEHSNCRSLFQRRYDVHLHFRNIIFVRLLSFFNDRDYLLHIGLIFFGCSTCLT